MTGLGIYGLSGGFRGAKGGLMDAKGYKEGGQIGYSIGGDLKLMSTSQLQELLNNPTLTPMEQSVIEEQLMLRARMENNPQTSKIMGGGVDTIPSGDMFEAAGGGIVAFSTGGGSKLKRPEDEISYTDLIRQRLANMDTGNPFEKSEEQTRQIQQGMEERKRMAPWEALTMAGLGAISGTSQYPGVNFGLGGIEAMKNYARSAAENAADQKLMLQQQVEAEKNKYARDTGNLNALIAAQSAKDVKEIGLLNARNTGAAAAAAREQTEYNRAENNYRTAVQRRIDSLIRDDKNKAIYEQNPKAIEREAEKFVQRNTSAKTLKTLGIDPIVDEPVTPAPGAKPAVATPTPVPAPTAGTFTVTAPNGKVYTFPTKEAADKFKAQFPKS